MVELPLTFEDGGYVHGVEWTQYHRSIQRYGILDGCQVTEDSPLGMSVVVQSGQIDTEDARFSVSEQTVSLDSADSTRRFDTIHIDPSGTATKTTGTAAPDASTPPSAPTIPEANILVAVVEVEADATQVDNADIRDSRFFSAAPETLPPQDEVFTGRLDDALKTHFDKRPWAAPIYASGPAHGSGTESSMFWGGVYLPDGRVALVPETHTSVGLFDPSDDSYTDGPTHGETGTQFFTGATLIPDGRVVLAPRDSDNVGLFDPSDDSYTSGPAHGEGDDAFRGAVLLPDGRVVLVPDQSSNIGLFDPSDDSYTSGPAHGEGSNAFRGATLIPDGRVVLAPGASSNIGLFDPSDNSYTSGPAHSEGASVNFESAMLLPDGRVVLSPAGSPNVGLFDPSDDSYTSGPSHPGDSTDAYRGTVMLPDGRVLLVPFSSNEVGLFDPRDDSVTAGATHSNNNTGGRHFAGGILVDDGRVVLVPRDEDVVGLVNVFSRPRDARNTCLHPLFNKL